MVEAVVDRIGDTVPKVSLSARWTEASKGLNRPNGTMIYEGRAVAKEMLEELERNRPARRRKSFSHNTICYSLNRRILVILNENKALSA